MRMNTRTNVRGGTYEAGETHEAGENKSGRLAQLTFSSRLVMDELPAERNTRQKRHARK